MTFSFHLKENCLPEQPNPGRIGAQGWERVCQIFFSLSTLESVCAHNNPETSTRLCKCEATQSSSFIVLIELLWSMLKMRIVCLWRHSASVKDSWALANASIDSSFFDPKVGSVSVFEISFERFSLLSKRDYVIALNSSNFSVDWEFKSTQISPLVAAQRIWWSCSVFVHPVVSHH